MTSITYIDKINELQEKINSLGNLGMPILKKIEYKFRLEWNYHSNAIEGNSLTKEETRSVMVNNITIKGKPIKDVLEMRGHDSVISDLFKIGKGELNISEKRIKEVHKGIMHEDITENQKKIGQWKTQNNHLLNYKNERIDFTPYNEVAEKMHELINWLNDQSDKIKIGHVQAMHPILLAFEFHLRYVTIHPFYDGNGRTSRIFTNLILISLGYPPVIVKVEDKQTYNRYLADIQVYGGDAYLFYEFMCKLLIRSQELVLKAAAGEDIDEPDDLDKKLLLLEKELASIDPDEEVRYRLSKVVFLNSYNSWVSDLLKSVIPMVQKFNKFFTGTQHQLHILPSGGNLTFSNEPAEEIISKLLDKTLEFKDSFQVNHEVELHFSTFYGTFIKGGLKTFGCNYGFNIKFELIKYTVMMDEFVPTREGGIKKKNIVSEKLLHKPLTQTEIKTITDKLADTILQHIDYTTKANGIRK